MSAHCSVSATVWPSRSCCLAYLDAWRYKPASNEIIDWSIAQLCGKYEPPKREGTAEMAEFIAGLQTRQEERYVIPLYLLLYKFFMTVALAVPPLTMKYRDVCLIGHVPLIGRVW